MTQTILNTIVDNFAEEEFMEKHLDNIIDPNEHIKKYFTIRLLLKIYLCICLIAELALLIDISFSYKGYLWLALSKFKVENINMNAIYYISNHIATFLSTCWGIKALSYNTKKDHFTW